MTQRRAVIAAVVSWSLVAVAGDAPMSQKAAEVLARSRYFDFELAEVRAGDWLAFLKQKEADEQAAAASWRPPRGGADLEPKDSPSPGRAQRALQAEFELVAKAREDEVRALAKQVLGAARSGALAPLAEDCTMYDATAKDRLALTQKHFAEQAAAWKKAAALATGDFDLQFTPPRPETGMPGKAFVSFGPEAKAPKSGARFPPRHQVELWWSGQVMPEANGPLRAAPAATPPKSRWRFHDLVLPYSREHLGLE